MMRKKKRKKLFWIPSIVRKCDLKIPSEIYPSLKMTVDCLNDAAAVIDITNESGEEIMLEGKDS